MAYALLAASVAGMAITMYVHRDPDSSLATVAAFAVFAAAFAALAAALYRPLFRRVPTLPFALDAAGPRGLTTRGRTALHTAMGRQQG